ncbi:MAG: translocation/assembly module TamB domain-containing protein [Candidatus Competibacteraceae bacterium]|nr:translocation/assembly module TamB domain-containing protein [Candidatus Competibacteraceae bacterium]
MSAPPTSPPAPPSPKRSDNAAAPPAKTPSTLRRVAVWLIGLPLVLLLLAFVLGGIGITTETGLNALLGQAKRFLPGQLSYEKISGRLSGPLHIEGLRYEDGPLTVKLATADFDWQPTALLDRHLNIGRLQFEGLEIHLPPAQETPPSTGPVVLPEIQLPLGITVADLQGRNIRIVPAGAEPIQIDAIDLKAQSTADGLTIETLNIKAPLGEATLSGQINPTGNYPLKLDLVWQAPLAGFGAFQGQGVIEGALRDKLTLTHKVTGPATLELDGEVRRPLGKAAWSAKAKLDVADLKSLVPDLAGKPLTFKLDAAGVMAQFQGKGELSTNLPELGPTTVQFSAAGDPNAIKLNELRLAAPERAVTLLTQGEVQFDKGTLAWFKSQGELNAAVPELGPATLQFNVGGDLKTVKLDGLRLTAPDRPLALTAQGEVQLQDLRFKATGDWKALAWPLRGIPQVESPNGKFTAEGTPKDYRFELIANELRGPNIPKGNWTITGQGSDQAVRDVKLAGQTLEGALQAEAAATWAPTVGWQATISGQGINPGAHWKDVPGKLNFRLKTDGGLENAALRANVLLEELTGTLSGQKVAGNADVSLRDQNLTIRSLQINAGDTRLEASGALTERWDLTWKLNAPQLKSLVPSVSGSVVSNGKLSGSRTQPLIAANFTVNNLKQGDTQIQQLRGEANIDVGSASRSQLKVSGENLRLGGQKWKSLRLEGSGTAAAHELKAEMVGDPGSFLLALAGSLQTPDMLWQGRIMQLSAKDTVAGNWNLEKPATVRASAKEANLDAACLSSAPTRLCLQGQWRQAGDFNGRAQLSNLNPEQFKRFFPKDVALTTNINGEATASGKIGGALQGKLNLTIAPGNVSLQAQGRPVQIAFNGGNVQLDTNGRTATGQARLDLGPLGQMQANLQVQDPLGAARLNGKIDASITDLKIVSAFAPQVTEISGQVRANVAVGGTAAKPTLRGDIRLENANMTIQEAGLKLRNIQFAATSTGQGVFQLSGSAQSEPGQLQLAGQLDPMKPQLNLTVTGENFQALKSTDLQVQVSPDLKIDFTPQLLRVEGTVTVPHAFLRPGGQRAGIVNTSGDAVIVKDRDGEAPQAKGAGMATYADVRVVLGKDVYLETPAFKGKLQGDIRVVETPQLAPRGTGNVEVVAGKYRIYGEEIEIQRGQLLFSSSPLDNPSLELRVVRQERDIISGNEIMAGAQIRGTVKKPKLTFFSTPTMSDPDVLAYLVLGRAPGGSGTETAMLFKAASALGSGQTGGASKGLSDAFGLDSAELGSTSQGGTSFMLGKNLTPRLYIGYGIGLLNAVNTFFLKYRFTKHLMLESATNSIGTGGDFIYTIER